MLSKAVLMIPIDVNLGVEGDALRLHYGIIYLYIDFSYNVQNATEIMVIERR